MSYLRTLFAILITISLALGPVIAGPAAAHAGGAEHSTVSASAPAMDMPDCHKAHRSTTGSPRKDCGCCDTKSACGGMSGCAGQCCKVLGMMQPVARNGAPKSVRYATAEPDRPPSLSASPPFTPPRS